MWWPSQNRQNLPLSKRWIKSPQTKTKREECNTVTSYGLEEDGSVLILWLFQPIALLSPLYEAGESSNIMVMAWKSSWDTWKSSWDGVENGVRCVEKFVRWRGKVREMAGTTSWDGGYNVVILAQTFHPRVISKRAQKGGRLLIKGGYKPPMPPIHNPPEVLGHSIGQRAPKNPALSKGANLSARAAP